MALTNIFDEDEGEENCKISINKKFAEKYQKFKECQELDKLKRKYGDDVEESSSTSESEDDDAEALTPQIEQDFLQTLSMIKQKDPKIYEKDTVFFHVTNTDDMNDKNNKETKEKKDKRPTYLKDYERQRLLEKGDKAYLSDDSDDGTYNVNGEIEKLKSQNGTPYVEEQEQLKKSLIEAAHSDSDGEDDLLHLRQKDSTDVSNNEESVVNKKLEKKGVVTNALSRYWNNDQLGEDEKFLRDYILKKQFIDADSSRVPAYNEIVGGSEEEEEEEPSEGEDEREQFERKFNFRYEEPDPEFIKRYPRTINESVRRKDDRRKTERKMREERKKSEKEKKKDELKRLKNLKRKEIMEKIEKLKEITGNQKVGFLEEDMQGDFDMSKYDELMEKVFDEDYYNDEDIVDEEKPIFQDDDDEEYIENYENYEDEEYIPHCEDPDFNMDADYVENSTKKDKKLSKKRSFNAKFADALQREKPMYDQSKQTFEEYFDEYYKLDFEDIIDDMPIRFKYREVVPNDFGLSTDEILKAEDKELNEWCSLKRTMEYIGEDEEKKLQNKFKKKARNKNKKEKVFSSLNKEPEKLPDDPDNPNLETMSKPRNIKQLQKKKAKLNSIDLGSKQINKKKALLIPSWNNHSRRSILTSVNKTRVKNIRKGFKGGSDKHINKLSLERLAAYGLDEMKKRPK